MLIEGLGQLGGRKRGAPYRRYSWSLGLAVCGVLSYSALEEACTSTGRPAFEQSERGACGRLSFQVRINVSPMEVSIPLGAAATATASVSPNASGRHREAKHVAAQAACQVGLS